MDASPLNLAVTALMPRRMRSASTSRRRSSSIRRRSAASAPRRAASSAALTAASSCACTPELAPTHPHPRIHEGTHLALRLSANLSLPRLAHSLLCHQHSPQLCSCLLRERQLGLRAYG